MAFMTKEWKGQETFPVEGVHHVEFYVGNAKQAVHFYRSAFGFQPHAYAGPETGSREQVSYVLKQGHVFLVLTTPLSSRHPGSALLARHGDFVHDVAFTVADPGACFAACVSRGAREAYAPRELEDSSGTVRVAGVRTYGDTIHTLVDGSGYRGLWAPGFVELKLPAVPGAAPGLAAIDHVVGNVEPNQMDVWSAFYESVFGFMTFVHFDENDISTQYSALKSKVVRSKNWRVKMPINEPAKGLKKSQIDEFLDFCEGPGVQHIALLTGDIIQAVSALRANGVEFLEVPDAYYENLEARVGKVSEELEVLRRHRILVDRDSDGYLLQLFTKPVEDRPTFFFEIIQRRGAVGFGQGNFQALFESIEREQARRGNL